MRRDEWAAPPRGGSRQADIERARAGGEVRRRGAGRLDARRGEGVGDAREIALDVGGGSIGGLDEGGLSPGSGPGGTGCPWCYEGQHQV